MHFNLLRTLWCETTKVIWNGKRACEVARIRYRHPQKSAKVKRDTVPCGRKYAMEQRFKKMYDQGRLTLFI